MTMAQNLEHENETGVSSIAVVFLVVLITAIVAYVLYFDPTLKSNQSPVHSHQTKKIWLPDFVQLF